ncbi:hypothetical protein EJ110_NYTH19334 [Nymphaea thermarum]|nr:hypothetical protein EJ110_NYTH19334 [Nymphaea thermarum]
MPRCTVSKRNIPKVMGRLLEDHILSNKIHEIQPLHVMHNVHQSGINCLHISQGKENVFHVVHNENMVKREQTHNSTVCLDGMLLLGSG